MHADSAVLEGGKTFWNNSSGRWAGEQLMRALAAGRDISPAELRTASVLRKDEWIHLDNELIAEAQLRLRGVADLIAAGLTIPVANSMGKTVFEYEKVSDMEAANVSLDGMVRGENDRPEFSLAGLPLPITHKDFFINLRTLTASRTRGESLDSTSVRLAGRKVAEASETMLFNGGKTFGGYTIYGYTNHPDRNIESFGAGGSWDQSAKTGAEILADVLTMMASAEADNMYGPYAIYVPRDASTKLEEDFKANTDGSIRDRILKVAGITSIRVADFLASGNVLLVQMTKDVVALVQGETLQTIQWDIEGGFGINFKAFQIQVPLIRSDSAGHSGIVHMS